MNFEKNDQKVFVYGTLKEDFGNHETMKFRGSKLHCKYSGIKGIMFHLGNFPAITVQEKRVFIMGEIHEVSWNVILQLDELEGTSYNHYKRVCDYIAGIGNVWYYVYSQVRIDALQNPKVVPDGLWKGPDTISMPWNGWGKGWIGAPPLELPNASSGAIENGQLARERIAEHTGNTQVTDLAKWKMDKKGDTYIRKLAEGRPGFFTITNTRTNEVHGPYPFTGDYKTAKVKLTAETKPKEPEYEVTGDIPGGPIILSSKDGYKTSKEVFGEEAEKAKN